MGNGTHPISLCRMGRKLGHNGRGQTEAHLQPICLIEERQLGARLVGVYLL